MNILSEKSMEDAIVNNPEKFIGEKGLRLLQRQFKVGSYIFDLLFEDRHGGKLIVEIQKGTLDRNHTYKILDYYHEYKEKNPHEFIDVMVIANIIPPERKCRLDNLGVAYKEVPENLFNNYKPEILEKTREILDNKFPQQNSFEGMKYNLGLIERLKTSENYKSFKEILPDKIKNEAEAKEIIEKNIGHLEGKHLKAVLELIDYPYPYKSNGKINKSPWFGSLLGKPNTEYIINEYGINKFKINQWFKILSDNHLTAEDKLDRLRTEPNKIKGLNVGFITLMLYLLDKTNYSIWLEVHHNGLNELIFPKLGKYNKSSAQYRIFNELTKEFAKKYDFEDTELDWVLWEGMTNQQVGF